MLARLHEQGQVELAEMLDGAFEIVFVLFFIFSNLYIFTPAWYRSQKSVTKLDKFKLDRFRHEDNDGKVDETFDAEKLQQEKPLYKDGLPEGISKTTQFYASVKELKAKSTTHKKDSREVTKVMSSDEDSVRKVTGIFSEGENTE